MFFVKLSFFIGGLLSGFIRDKRHRRRFRGTFNLTMLRPYISRMIKRQYGIKIESLKFVRQQSLNRVVGIVNNTYYVKIFRTIPKRHVQDFAQFMRYIEQELPVKVPHIVADDKISMYSYEKIDGFMIKDMDVDFVKKHKTKVINQIKKFIQQLQSINIDNKTNKFDYFMDIHNKTSFGAKRVLAHCDTNFGSFLFDKDLNLIAVIDWDTVAITDNLDADWNLFMGYWNNTKRWK